MHDFQRKGYSQYGASMGRRSDLPEDTDDRLEIRRVPIDEGGYDPGGAYWGTGTPLFMVEDEEGRIRYLRARDADAAKREFPNARWTVSTRGPSSADIEDMLQAYIEAALWSSTDESDESGGEPMDKNYGPDDVAEETVARMRKDVTAFAKKYGPIIESFGADYDWSQAGHDLWLTRNGHGVGFEDRDLPEKDARTLADAARRLGEVYLYVGDDGQIYSD